MWLWASNSMDYLCIFFCNWDIVNLFRSLLEVLRKLNLDRFIWHSRVRNRVPKRDNPFHYCLLSQIATYIVFQKKKIFAEKTSDFSLKIVINKILLCRYSTSLPILLDFFLEVFFYAFSKKRKRGQGNLNKERDGERKKNKDYRGCICFLLGFMDSTKI